MTVKVVVPVQMWPVMVVTVVGTMMTNLGTTNLGTTNLGATNLGATNLGTMRNVMAAVTAVSTMVAAAMTTTAMMTATAVAAGFSGGRGERCQTKSGRGDECEKCSTFKHCGISLAGLAISPGPDDGRSRCAIPLMTSQTDRRRNFAATREKQLSAQLLLQLSAQLLLNERACRTIPALMPTGFVEPPRRELLCLQGHESAEPHSSESGPTLLYLGDSDGEYIGFFSGTPADRMMAALRPALVAALVKRL